MRRGGEISFSIRAMLIGEHEFEGTPSASGPRFAGSLAFAVTLGCKRNPLLTPGGKSRFAVNACSEWIPVSPSSSWFTRATFQAPRTPET
jgi:hypothetical protein